MRLRVPKDHLAWLSLTLALSMIAGLLLSPKLWVSTRPFPLTPLFDIVSPLAYPLDYALLGLLISLVAFSGIAHGRWTGWCALGAVAILAFLIVEDQVRLQPWVYQYLFMLAAVGLCRLGRLGTEGALNTCRLIVAFTYLWSGLQKANASFVSVVYPWLVEPLAAHLPLGVEGVVSYGAYAVPAAEAAIGVGLLIPQTRKPAVVGALLMHALILASLGPWGHDWNTVVWPWNVAMVAFAFILFWRSPEEPTAWTMLRPGRSLSFEFAFRSVVLILFAFMPLMSFFGLWDSYLSASLYSGNIKRGEVVAWDGSQWVSTDISYLAMQEMNEVVYPEERIFKNVFAKVWCDGEHRDPEPFLRVHSRPAILSGERSTESYGCEDVEGVVVP